MNISTNDTNQLRFKCVTTCPKPCIECVFCKIETVFSLSFLKRITGFNTSVLHQTRSTQVSIVSKCSSFFMFWQFVNTLKHLFYCLLQQYIEHIIPPAPDSTGLDRFGTSWQCDIFLNPIYLYNKVDLTIQV